MRKDFRSARDIMRMLARRFGRQVRLARALGTGEPQVSRILRGRRRPSLELARRMAELSGTEAVVGGSRLIVFRQVCHLDVPSERVPRP